MAASIYAFVLIVSIGSSLSSREERTFRSGDSALSFVLLLAEVDNYPLWSLFLKSWYSFSVRCAIIADIHSNLEAFTAVLKDVQKKGGEE